MPRTLIVQPPEKGVCLITLHRPEALNALSTELLGELAEALDLAEGDSAIGAVVITGSRKAFAAGADLMEMAERDLVGVLQDPRVRHWQRIAAFSKPLVAAVNGFALGGGCELAMHADILIAGAMPASASPRSISASSPARVAPNVCCGRSASRWPCRWCSPAKP